MKKNKSELKRDSVISNTLHVGIELETYAPGGDDIHDDDACFESHLDYLRSCSTAELLESALGVTVSREDGRTLSSYIDTDALINSEMDAFECGGGCSHTNTGCDRDEISRELKRLTGNNSIKVVEDGSISCDSDESDAEVCWNYFVSKDTIKDNAKILQYLKENDHKFNTSCGLHINLNNYLNIPSHFSVNTSRLDFLFNFVGASRRTSQYCNRKAISGSEKYSMLYNQTDRIEFRFFSPTFEAAKLHHYVVLANTVYKKLAGKKCRLPKKSYDYFLNKMQRVNGLDKELAEYSVRMLESIPAIEVLAQSIQVDGDASSDSESEVA